MDQSLPIVKDSPAALLWVAFVSYNEIEGYSRQSPLARLEAGTLNMTKHVCGLRGFDPPRPREGFFFVQGWPSRIVRQTCHRQPRKGTISQRLPLRTSCTGRTGARHFVMLINIDGRLHGNLCAECRRVVDMGAASLSSLMCSSTAQRQSHFAVPSHVLCLARLCTAELHMLCTCSRAGDHRSSGGLHPSWPPSPAPPPCHGRYSHSGHPMSMSHGQPTMLPRGGDRYRPGCWLSVGDAWLSVGDVDG
jgi:hypothetical protein